jgi:peroxiredoxin Q/BCP
MARLEVSNRAPAFTLVNQDGAAFSPKDLVGQRYVLYFYPADEILR